eukprot:7583997-Ditylum_brightwellii.AAC.1
MARTKRTSQTQLPVNHPPNKKRNKDNTEGEKESISPDKNPPAILYNQEETSSPPGTKPSALLQNQEEIPSPHEAPIFARDRDPDKTSTPIHFLSPIANEGIIPDEKNGMSAETEFFCESISTDTSGVHLNNKRIMKIGD